MARTATQSAQGSRFWLVVLAACVGAFVVAYNTTAVMTALPAIKTSLDLDVDTLQWVINLYMLASASSLAALGHFADRFGMMRIFAIGLCTFGLGSITIAFSGDAMMLLAGRAFQGLGVAALIATSVALISVAAPKQSRAQALGVWAGALAFGFALGPLIGGALTDAVSWRAIFGLDIVILAVAASLCLWVSRLGLVPHALEAGTRVDTLGIALLFVTLSSFLYGLTSGQLAGWTSLQTLLLFAAAVLGAAAFVVRELRAHDPLIKFGFFRHTNYAASAACMFLHGFTQIGVLYFFNLFLQAPDGLGFSASQAGLALLPFTFAMLTVSLAVPRLLPPDSIRWPLTFGMLALVLGYWLMHDINSQTPYGEVWWKLAILGVGVGFNWSLLPRVGLSVLPDASAGQGAGVINTCMFVGLATGTAAGGVLASEIKHTAIDPVVVRLSSGAADLGNLATTLVHGSQSQITRALGQLSPDDTAKITLAIHDGFDKAFSGVMVMMAAAGLAGALLCVALIRSNSSKANA